MRQRVTTAAITLGELARLDPFAAVGDQAPLDPARRVQQVVLAADFDRLRRTVPHSLVVLHGDVATGGWSLAAALHVAWERNLAGVVVARSLITPAGSSLAQRLGITVLAIDCDPVDAALHLAGAVSAPAAARALRQAQCAERLAEQNGIRGILGVLNSELGSVPVALVAGDAVLAGRVAAIAPRTDAIEVAVEVRGPGDRPWARLVAALPRSAADEVEQVQTVLRLARPSLQAAWAQTRLDSSLHAVREQAAFALLRRLATEPKHEPVEIGDREVPSWSNELGWHVEGVNRAVWLAPLRSADADSEELSHLIRAAWQQRTAWPLVSDAGGWVSWQSTDADDVGPLRRLLAAFSGVAVGHELAVGVGRGHRGVPGLLRSVAEARLAAHVARTEGPGTIRWFDNVGPGAALAWLPAAEIAQVADLCLSEIVAARDREVLVQTVLAVLDCGGSLSQASQRLGVHRNTVLARVVRARELGLTFEDPQRRLALHVLCYSLASLWRLDEPRAPGPP